ncbi:MAG: hypothetical protein ACFNLH_07920 [Corynebacterium matruchotii]
MTIDTSWVSQRNAVFLADPAARLAGNAVAATDVTGLARPWGGRRRVPLLAGDRLCPSTRKHE